LSCSSVNVPFTPKDTARLFGNKKERVVSDPLLIVACSLNQSSEHHIGENTRMFKQDNHASRNEPMAAPDDRADPPKTGAS
jgi:hypothetical protein